MATEVRGRKTPAFTETRGARHPPAVVKSPRHLIGIFGYGKSRGGRSGAMTENVTMVLRKTPLFASLTEQEKQALAARVDKKRFQRGELLFSEGDSCPGLFLGESGQI